MPVKPEAALASTQDRTIRNGIAGVVPSTPPLPHHEGILGGVRDALEKELASERAEAKEEADQGWPASVRAILQGQDGEGKGSSVPGTPGGSRIRFDLTNGSDSHQIGTPVRPGTPKKKED